MSLFGLPLLEAISDTDTSPVQALNSKTMQHFLGCFVLRTEGRGSYSDTLFDS